MIPYYTPHVFCFIFKVQIYCVILLNLKSSPVLIKYYFIFTIVPFSTSCILMNLQCTLQKINFTLRNRNFISLNQITSKILSLENEKLIYLLYRCCLFSYYYFLLKLQVNRKNVVSNFHYIPCMWQFHQSYTAKTQTTQKQLYKVFVLSFSF